MTVRVVQAPAAIDALLNEPGALVMVTEGAAAVAQNAAAIVPHHTGHAAESYTSTVAEVGPDGVTATAYTTDFAGSLIEFGSVNNPAYRPLTRGVERAGLVGRPYPKGSE